MSEMDKEVCPLPRLQGSRVLAPELHAAGLTQKQLDRVTDGYNKFANEQMQQQQQAWMKDQSDAQAKLEREWGLKTPQEIEHNRRAMRAIGMTVDEAESYMRSGSEKFLRMLNLAGHMIAEDNSGDIVSDETLGFGLTPNRAAAELQELKANSEFMKRVYGGDHAAKAKYDRLVKATSDGGMVRRTIRSGYSKPG